MALTTDRETTRRTGDVLSLKAAASKLYYAGSLVARDANGRATPGATATTLRGVGRCREQVDNSAGADDATSVTIEKGIFRFANSATDPCSCADIGTDCYIVDDFTVSKTNSGGNTQSVAGKVFDVDAQGVWVDMR